MEENNYYYPRQQHTIEVPNVFEQQDLDPEMVSDLSQMIISQTQAAEAERMMDEANNQYHMKRLAEQAEGMSPEEAFMMAKHFDEEILIEALRWHSQVRNRFLKQVISASKQTLAEMEN